MIYRKDILGSANSKDLTWCVRGRQSRLMWLKGSEKEGVEWYKLRSRDHAGARLDQAILRSFDVISREH